MKVKTKQVRPQRRYSVVKVLWKETAFPRYNYDNNYILERIDSVVVGVDNDVISVCGCVTVGPTDGRQS